MINKVILVGHVGRDPELRYTASGTAVANFSLATNRRRKDRDGEWQEETEWHRVVAWGRTAEVVNQYASKGRQLYIEGRLQTRDWEDRDGNKRYTTEVIAELVKLLGSRHGEGDFGSSGPPDAPDAPDAPSGPSGQSDTPVTDDDIPF